MLQAHTLVRRAVALAAMAAIAPHAPYAHAQTAPDGGQVLRQLQPLLQAPQPGALIDIQPPARQATTPGGPQVTLAGIQFSGHTVFTSEALLAATGDVQGRAFDLAGLRALADAVSAHYRNNGYPFARALVPAQTLDDQILHIEVIEGRYGQVRALADDATLAARGQALLTGLQPGAVIQSATLERATLLLDDLPGVDVSPLIRPGQAAGTGDLDVTLQRGPRVAGQLGLDNAGNRYTGQHRAKLDLDLNSPFLLGDQLSLRALATDERMWFGGVDYSAPVGASGLRAQGGYSRSAYTLGKGFASLRATGTADVASLGLTYPLVRSQRLNLTLGGAYQHKQLVDRQRSTDTRSDKSSNVVPLTLRFDLRDALGQGGLTYGLFSWSSGNLQLDPAARALDRATARTEGRFDKANLDVARIQALPGNWTLHARVAAQWAPKNLDSSEGFGLGGADAVRAYPSGEGYGDRGWLGQVELRHAIGSVAPYVFHDAGRIARNARPWEAGDNSRSLGGAGVGVRAQPGNWSVDAALAWRTHGGDATSDTSQRKPRLWVTAAYRF